MTRYRCTDPACEFSTASYGKAIGHEAKKLHEIEEYEVFSDNSNQSEGSG